MFRILLMDFKKTILQSLQYNDEKCSIGMTNETDMWSLVQITIVCFKKS